MRGYLVKREGKKATTWQIRIFAEDPATGNEKMTYCKVFKGLKRDAEQKKRQLMTEMENNKYVKPTNLTVGELLDKWYEEYVLVENDVNTIRGYQQRINNHLKPELGHYHLNRLTTDNVRQYYTKLRKSGNLRNGEGLSNQSILHIHRILKQAFNWAIFMKLTNANPLVGMKNPKIIKDSDKLQHLNNSELYALLQACSGTIWETPIYIAAYTGARQEEVLGLCWDCVDMKAKTITIRRTTVIVDGETQLKNRAKNHTSKRTINISDKLIKALKKEQETQALRKLAFGDLYQSRNLVCAREDGSFMHGSNLTIGLQRILKKAELPIVNFHALRHTHISLLIMNSHKLGTDILSISKRAGHSSIRTTMDTYGHLMPGQQEKTAGSFDMLLDSATESEPNTTATVSATGEVL